MMQLTLCKTKKPDMLKKKTPKESSRLLTRIRDIIVLLLAYLVSDSLQESFWILMAARILD